MPESANKPLRIGISLHDFLHLPGAIDLLRMIIRGLRQEDKHKFFLLMDTVPDNLKHRLVNICQDKLSNYVCVPFLVKRVMWKLERTVRKYFSKVSLIYPNNHISAALANLIGMELIGDLELLLYESIPKGIETIANKYNIDVIIPTTFDLSTPFVSYIYDCQHKYYPENFQPNEISLRDKCFYRLIDTSTTIIVNSLDAKNDLLKFYSADEKKIISLPFTPQIEQDALSNRVDLLGKYKLPDKYFMISNQFWVHKSHETALEALQNIMATGIVDCHIVFTGQMNDPRFPEYVPKFLRMVEEMKLGDHTTFLGYIPKRDQLEIMKRSTAVIQTSLFEGGPGGGSIADAIALGVRAIVSNIPVNRELPLSKSLVLFEPKNAKDLSDKMKNYWFADFKRPSDQILRERERNRLKSLSQTLYRAINQAVKISKITPSKVGADYTISVITVCKNDAENLQKTISNVSRQCHRKIEYIVIDGGSTDHTRDILTKFSNNVKFISEPDDGIYYAMNKGIKMATGDLLYFLNAGDVLYDNSVFKDVLSIVARPENQNIGFFYGDVQFVKQDGSEGRLLQYNFFPFYYYAFNCQCHQACFYRPEVFEYHGLYDTSFKVYGDQEFNARIIVKNKIRSLHLNRTIVRYLEGGFSSKTMTSGLNQLEKRRIKELYFKEIPDSFFNRIIEELS